MTLYTRVIHPFSDRMIWLKNSLDLVGKTLSLLQKVGELRITTKLVSKTTITENNTVASA